MNQDNLYAENKGCKLHWGHSQIGMNHRCQNKLLKVQDLVLYVLQKLNCLPDQLRNHGWNNLQLIRLKAKNKLEEEIKEMEETVLLDVEDDDDDLPPFLKKR